MPVLVDDQLSEALSSLSEWKGFDGAITRTFKFKDFTEAFAFMNKVAVLAEDANHHPDWSNSYNTVVISLSSHDEGGVTERDIELAKKIDSLTSG